MVEIKDLEQQIEEKLKAAEEREQLRQNHLQQRMQEFQHRHQRYTEIADRLMENVIRPRMLKLPEHFANARFPASEQGRHHSVCCLEHTERYPATTRLELSVTHDGTYENLSVIYTLQILPVLFRFQGEDKLTMPLNGVTEEQAAAWVQDKILSFVDTYLRIEATDQYRAENLVLDPVCGMRLDKAFASAKTQHRGETYYFCLEGCMKKFVAEPDRYLNAVGTQL
jgi:YHS domain-containing protein